MRVYRRAGHFLLRRDAAVAYTHLNRLGEKFADVVCGEWAQVVEAIRSRAVATAGV